MCCGLLWILHSFEFVVDFINCGLLWICCNRSATNQNKWILSFTLCWSQWNIGYSTCLNPALFCAAVSITFTSSCTWNLLSMCLYPDLFLICVVSSSSFFCDFAMSTAMLIQCCHHFSLVRVQAGYFSEFRTCGVNQTLRVLSLFCLPFPCPFLPSPPLLLLWKLGGNIIRRAKPNLWWVSSKIS